VKKKTLFWCISKRKVLWKATATTLPNTPVLRSDGPFYGYVLWVIWGYLQRKGFPLLSLFLMVEKSSYCISMLNWVQNMWHTCPGFVIRYWNKTKYIFDGYLFIEQIQPMKTFVNRLFMMEWIYSASQWVQIVLQRPRRQHIWTLLMLHFLELWKQVYLLYRQLEMVVLFQKLWFHIALG